MYEIGPSYQGKNLDQMSRDNVVEYINDAFNTKTNAAYTNHTRKLGLLSEDTLRTIARLIAPIDTKDKRKLALKRQIAHRTILAPKSVGRFVKLVEQEYETVTRDFIATYGITPKVITVMEAIAGVLTLKDTRHNLTEKEQRRVIMFLVASAHAGALATEVEAGRHGQQSSVSEAFFYSHLLDEDYPDDHYHQLLTTLCSGYKYNRFLEVIEAATGSTVNPLLTGVL